jgi:hypothetical protein
MMCAMAVEVHYCANLMQSQSLKQHCMSYQRHAASVAIKAKDLHHAIKFQ